MTLKVTVQSSTVGYLSDSWAFCSHSYYDDAG